MPRRAAGSTLSNGTGNTSIVGARGMHARPDHDDSPDWTGWWTPIRVPAGPDDDWQQPPPVYATAEPLTPERSSSAAPLGQPAAALPPAPPRPADLAGPARTTHFADGNGAEASIPVSTIGTASDGSPDPLLARRVPQANLVPELRRSASTDEPVPVPSAPPDAEQARDALSRFQASRQAAQQQVGVDGVTSNGGGRR